MPEVSAAVCAKHSTASAVATCRRCGVFLCDACVVVLGEESYCEDCRAKVDGPVTKRARLALVFALLTLGLMVATLALTSWLSVFGLPLDVVAIALTVAERRKLKRGEISERNWAPLTWASIVCGVVLLLWVPWGFVLLREVLEHLHRFAH